MVSPSPNPNFQSLHEDLRNGFELFLPPVEALAARYPDDYPRDADFILEKLRCFAAPRGLGMRELLGIYAEFLEEAVRDRELYRATGRYRHETEEEIAPLFEDPDFKLRYLLILTLSTVLNRNRYELSRHYRSCLPKYLKRDGLLLEIGAGNCLDTLFASAHGRVEAYELNEWCLAWRDLLSLGDRVRLRLELYGFEDRQTFDFVSLIELLEHVSEPQTYLDGVRRVLKDDGRAFLTFAVRMPQVDHLYHFPNVEACRDMVASSDLLVLEDHCIPDTYPSSGEADPWVLADDKNVAVTYLCVVGKGGAAPADPLIQAFNEDLDGSEPGSEE